MVVNYSDSDDELEIIDEDITGVEYETRYCTDALAIKGEEEEYQTLYADRAERHGINNPLCTRKRDMKA